MAGRDSHYIPLNLLFCVVSEMQRQSGNGLASVLFQPSLDMFETADSLVLKVEAAGIQPNQIHVTLSADDSTITVGGERLEPLGDHHDRQRSYHLEIYYGAFEREISLPPNVKIDRDRVTAKFRDGFLIVTLPKKARQAPEKRTIEISSD
jgi:HSP20 family protein